MNKQTRVRKSLLSARSAKSSFLTCTEEHFGTVVSTAARNLGCPINVIVHSQFVDDPKPAKRKNKSLHGAPHFNADLDEDSSDTISEIGSTTDIKITGIYSATDNLSEVLIKKYMIQAIPRVVIQILAAILPNYKRITKITITDSRINLYTILELKNMLSVTNITDVCLDSTILPESNYSIILQQPKLRNLSLKRCSINDEVCQEISAQLHYLKPGAALVTLNLSTNFITDVGAKSIGEALRTNRRLRHLNLADNHITDQGATYILDSLKEFLLTYNDNLDKQKQYMRYLKRVKEISIKCMNEFETRSTASSVLKSSGKNKLSAMAVINKSNIKKEKRSFNAESQVQEDFANTKVALMALDLLGPFNHPYSTSKVTKRDGYFYSKGNLVLCSLNLAYNELTFPSLQKLLKVVEYQQVNRTDHYCGLMRVIVEGNRLPSNCTELELINDIFKKYFIKYLIEGSPGRRKSLRSYKDFKSP